jgi:hypothetical protein
MARLRSLSKNNVYRRPFDGQAIAAGVAGNLVDAGAHLGKALAVAGRTAAIGAGIPTGLAVDRQPSRMPLATVVGIVDASSTIREKTRNARFFLLERPH